MCFWNVLVAALRITRTHKTFEGDATLRHVALLCRVLRLNRCNFNNSRRALKSLLCGLVTGKSLMY